jgi:predicted permease
VAVATFAIGIACTTTVFSWTDGLLMPYRGAKDGWRLAAVEAVTEGAPNGSTQTSYLDCNDYRANVRSLSDIALRYTAVFAVGERIQARPVWGEVVSANYFEVLGLEPALGRAFTAEDELGPPVVVISEQVWKSRFRADPGVIGRAVRINGREVTVLGVTPREFRGTMPIILHDVWIPARSAVQIGLLDPDVFKRRDFRSFHAFARLRDGIDMGTARAELATFARTLSTAYPKTNRRTGATLLPLWEEHNGVNQTVMGPIKILGAAALVLLFIVCANVANLLLARLVARRREFGIRIAIGAHPSRLARLLLVEALLLSFGGTVVGWLLHLWMGGAIVALVPSVGIPLDSGAAFNWHVLAFSALCCCAAALLAGAAPALSSWKTDVNETLKEGGRSGSGHVPHTTRGLLVTAEVALAAIALCGAGLFVRSLQKVIAAEPGFDRSNVLFARFFVQPSSFSTQETQVFFQRLREVMRSVPGVQAASYSDFTPLSTTGGPWSDVEPEGYVAAPGERLAVNRATISPGHLESLGIPLLSGRDFREDDAGQSQPVIMVNETFAKRYFGGRDPVGRKVRSRGKVRTVVGLVRDAKYFSPAEAPRPFFYYPFSQTYGTSFEVFFFARTAGDPEQAMGTLRNAVNSVDPRASAFHAMTLKEYTQVAVLPQRIAATLLSALGLASLAVAALGLYSVMAYAVSLRTQEIGIRLAMGARPADVVSMVLRDGMKLALVGIVAGVGVALALARLLSRMLVGVSAADPLTYVSASGLLFAIAMVACWIPARRATRVDPMEAFRS